MRSHLLKHTMPAALLSAVAIVLTLGVSAAQAALVRGRGAPRGAALTSHGGTSVGVIILSSVILALVVGLVIYAVVVSRRDRRERVVAVPAGEPARLPGAGDSAESERARKAA
jgi:hypothetical protein